MAFITANYFLKSHYADRIRAFILYHYHINKIADFGSTKVFESAQVDTNILFLSKQSLQDFFIYGLLKNDNYLTPFLELLIESKHTSLPVYAIAVENQNEMTNAPWVFLQESQTIKTISLGDVCNVGKGVATGNDNIFVVDAAVAIKDKFEREIIKPLVSDASIDKYKFEVSSSVLIAMKRGASVDQYPNVKNYLQQHRSLLEKRYAVKNEGLQWYEIVRMNEDLFSANVGEQIYCYYRSPHNKFALSKSNYATLTTTFVLTDKKNQPLSLKYVLGILNSSYLESYTKANAKKMGKCFEFSSNFLRSIPIPDATPAEQAPIIQSVEAILEANRANPAADVTAHEAKLDGLVNALYGLEPTPGGKPPPPPKRLILSLNSWRGRDVLW